MPEAAYTTTMSLPRSVIWDFVKDMDNWAPLLTGYQSHEILDDTDSVWTLKGDIGILRRVVRLRAHITEWVDEDRVGFTLTGLNEKVEGGGVLVMRDVDPGKLPAAPPRRWFGRRFLEWLARRLFHRVHGPAESRALPAADAAQAYLSITLRMDAGGPTGPLVNAVLGPALLPAAEDLANRIAAHLERQPRTEGSA